MGERVVTPPDKWGQVDRMSGEVAVRRAATRAVRAERELALALAELAAERIEHERVHADLFERNVRADAEIGRLRAELVAAYASLAVARRGGPAADETPGGTS